MITEDNLNAIISQRGNIVGVMLRACPITTQEEENVSDIYLIDDDGNMELLNEQLALPISTIDESSSQPRLSLKAVLETKREPTVDCIGDNRDDTCTIVQEEEIFTFDSSGTFLLTGFSSPIETIWIDGVELTGVPFQTSPDFMVLNVAAGISVRPVGSYSIRVQSEAEVDLITLTQTSLPKTAIGVLTIVDQGGVPIKIPG